MRARNVKRASFWASLFHWLGGRVYEPRARNYGPLTCERAQHMLFIEIVHFCRVSEPPWSPQMSILLGPPFERKSRGKPPGSTRRFLSQRIQQPNDLRLFYGSVRRAYTFALILNYGCARDGDGNPRPRIARAHGSPLQIRVQCMLLFWGYLGVNTLALHLGYLGLYHVLWAFYVSDHPQTI